MEQLWMMSFVSVLSLRFHPRNDVESSVEDKVEFAAYVADIAVKEAERRFICLGSRLQ